MKKSPAGVARRHIFQALGLAAALPGAQAQQAPPQPDDLEQARALVKRNREALRKTVTAREVEPAFRFEA